MIMNSRTRFITVALVLAILCGCGLAKEGEFSWKDTKGQYCDLFFGGKKVLRYMYAYDTSSEQRRFETYKPLYHVYDARGNRLTNGPDGENPYGDGIKYPHHRGIFIGWNKLRCAGRQYDLWHMKGVAQVHKKFLVTTGGPKQAVLTTIIHWNDREGKPIIEETRQMTVHRQGGSTILLLDFQTDLKAVAGDVDLDGDPEHAGFQYRPHNGVAKGPAEGKAKYLFHKDGIDPKKDKDLPWVGMSYGLNARLYSVQHMSHPKNPRGAVYSAYRDYGRFGAFFKHKIEAGKTLTLRYCILVTEGSMPELSKMNSNYAAYLKRQ